MMTNGFFTGLLLLSTLSCTGQTGGKKPGPSSPARTAPAPARTMEKFDFADFNRRTAADPGGNVFTRPDGTEVEMLDGEEPFMRETLPAPSFEAVYKEYYADGTLKAKGRMIGPLLKVGPWHYYAADGSLQREVNESARFGRIGPAQVLEILEREGYINRRTGKGRGTVVLNYERMGSVLDGAATGGKWLVELTEGARNEPPFEGPGEPSVYKSLFLQIDGETGKILKKHTD